MNVGELKESFQCYKAQLEQVTCLLPTADPITKLELYDLEKDLKEIIQVTRDNIVALGQGNSSLTAEASSSTFSEESIQTTTESTKNELIHDGLEEFDFVGTKCRVKYTQEWGSFQYHNAMVLSYEEDEEAPSIQVRVLFLYPIHISMVPCKYFLDGNCNYSEEQCRFSHGHVVDINELKEFEEPDFTQLSVGSKCLARHDDNGVWYKAVVSDIHDEQVTVSFETYNESITLDFHEILPVVEFAEEDDTSTAGSEDNFEDVCGGVVGVSYKSIAMVGLLGDWEEHTRGIASKLMAKMGYITGKGLGKDSQGRLEPIPIRLLPPGKSLDVIAELREKGKIKDPTKRKKTKGDQGTGCNQEKGTTKAAFDLINKLTHKGGPKKSFSLSDVKLKFGLEDTYKHLKKNISSKQQRETVTSGVQRKQNKINDINVHMFRNSEKITALQKKLEKQKEALARNPGNSAISRTIKKNIEVTVHELDELYKMDKSLQDQLHMKRQSKKLSIF